MLPILKKRLTLWIVTVFVATVTCVACEMKSSSVESDLQPITADLRFFELDVLPLYPDLRTKDQANRFIVRAIPPAGFTGGVTLFRAPNPKGDTRTTENTIWEKVADGVVPGTVLEDRKAEGGETYAYRLSGMSAERVRIEHIVGTFQVPTDLWLEGENTFASVDLKQKFHRIVFTNGASLSVIVANESILSAHSIEVQGRAKLKFPGYSAPREGKDDPPLPRLEISAVHFKGALDIYTDHPIFDGLDSLENLDKGFPPWSLGLQMQVWHGDVSQLSVHSSLEGLPKEIALFKQSLTQAVLLKGPEKNEVFSFGKRFDASQYDGIYVDTRGVGPVLWLENGETSLLTIEPGRERLVRVAHSKLNKSHSEGIGGARLVADGFEIVLRSKEMETQKATHYRKASATDSHLGEKLLRLARVSAALSSAEIRIRPFVKLTFQMRMSRFDETSIELEASPKQIEIAEILDNHAEEIGTYLKKSGIKEIDFRFDLLDGSSSGYLEHDPEYWIVSPYSRLTGKELLESIRSGAKREDIQSKLQRRSFVLGR